MADERPPQRDHAVDLRPVSQFARRVDDRAGVSRAPRPDGVEVFQGEPDGIHHLVTARARGVRAVLHHLLTHRPGGLARFGFLERGDVGRRRRRRRAENILEHPLPTENGRRTGRMGCDGEQAAFAKKAPARFVRQHDAAELAAVDARDAVMAREPFVDESVVGGQQIEDVAILANHAFEKQFGFAGERLTQVVVEIREVVRVRQERLQVANLQPLPGEVGDECRRFRIGQHALDLALEPGGVAKRALARRRQQLFVRDAAPEKERQPRRQLDVADAVDAARRRIRRILLDAKDKLRAREDQLQRALNAALERTVAA